MQSNSWTSHVMLVSVQSARTFIDYWHNNPMLRHPRYNWAWIIFFCKTVGAKVPGRKPKHLFCWKSRSLQTPLCKISKHLSWGDIQLECLPPPPYFCHCDKCRVFVNMNLQYELWICASYTGTIGVHLLLLLLLGALCMLISFPWPSHTQPLFFRT